MTKLYPFQEEGVDKIEWWDGRALLADDPGLGKTIQILAWIDYRMRVRKDLRRSLIICPAGVKLHWEREAWKHFSMKSLVLSSRRARKIRNKIPLVIINYDVLVNWLPVLIAWKPQLLAFDECHMISNWKAKRSRASVLISEGGKFIIGASGTPLTHRPADLWNILHITRPDIFSNRWDYFLRYCAPTHTSWGWTYTGASHLEELHKRLISSCMIRRRKDDVLQDLPPKRRHVIIIDIDNRKEYDWAEQDFLSWLASFNDLSRVKKAMRAQAIVKMTNLKRLVGKGKVPFVRSWIDSYLAESTDKINVFGIHIEDFLDKLQEIYGKSCVKIDGSIRGKKRDEALKYYLETPSVRLMLGQLKAAGVYWSATGVSTTVIGEFGWAPGDHIQAEDRTRGIKRGVKGRSSESYWLVAKDTIEEKLIEILFVKQENISKVLDGEEGKDKLDVFNKLLDSYWRKSKVLRR